MSENSTIDNSSTKGHILMFGTLVVTFILPLSLILLSYEEIGIISGVATYVTAAAVIGSAIYIIFGGAWMFFQDKKDGEQLTNG
jgi:hypothetical protein